MKTKDVLLLVILLILGIVVGGFVGSAVRTVPWASFLGYSKSFGFAADQPAVLNFSVLRIAFGFQINLNIAQAICLVAAVLLYRKIH